MEKLRRLVVEQDIDIVALTETNRNWKLESNENTIWEAMKRWKPEARTYAAHNVHDINDKIQQYGGVSMSIFGKLTRHKQQYGTDERGLGRFSWVTTAGTDNHKTTFISAYCPNESNLEGSVWTQQLTAMDDQPTVPNYDHPRRLFWDDLKQIVEHWVTLGHRIVLTGDFNSEFNDVCKWMLELGLVDLICEQHGYDKAPKTHLRSKNSPIDAIFGSPYIRAKRSGYLSFKKLGGDHRGLWIDIPAELLLGYNPPTCSMHHARRLKMEDPRIVKKYNDTLHKLLSEQDIYKAMSHLHRHATYPAPVWFQNEYERIDRTIQDCMEEAEKKCRKFRCGNVKWSPLYQEIHDTIDYWKARIRMVQLRGRPNKQLLIRLQKKLEIKYERLSIDQMQVKLKEAHQRRKKYKKMAEEQSIEYRHQLAKAKEEAGNKSAASYLRDLNEKEAIRKLFHKIKTVEQKLRAGSTSHVQVTNAQGQKEIYHQQKDIEQIIMKINEAKYHQTEGCSELLHEDLISLFGHHGEKDTIESVLDGSFDPPAWLSQDTKDFLSACRRTENISDIPIKEDPVSRFHDFIQSWSPRKEKTMTANQHIGHYKSGIQHPHIGWLLFQRHEIPGITGYSPLRHRQCVDLIILKKSGNIDAAKQRTLGILDTEFNHINGGTGREGMHAAVDHGLMATEQYSRPGRSAIDHALNRILVFDHFKYQRTPFCLASSDLKGCYDRIIHIAAYLAMRRVGVRRPKLIAMFKTIQHMIHKIRTAFGDSESTYGGIDLEEWENYAQGVLQGNASGPQIWSILSSVIFDILHSRGYSVTFCNCLSKSMFSLLGFSYVDDCDLLQAQSNPRDTLSSMQEVINSWSDLMAVTGGQIEASKSWWYLADVTWKKGKWIISDALPEASLTLMDGENEINLQRLKVHQASEMLGVWMCPNGDHSKMLQELRQVSARWASKIQAGNPSREVAWTALHKTISAKLKYSMPISTFSEEECKYIMAPAIAIGLQKSGICSTFPTAARHAPITSGGLHVLNLHTEMGVSRTVSLLEHCHRNTPTGDLIHLNIEHLVLEAGLYGPIWQFDMNKVAEWCDNKTWLFHTLKFNHDNGIELNIDHFQLKAQRTNDRAIMDLAMEYTNDHSTLQAINRIRMIHEVVHLSDITTANGQRVDPAFLISDPFPESRNHYSWPAKHKICPNDYTIWRQFMNHIYRYHDFRLQRGLRQWIKEMSPTNRDSWHWFLDKDSNLLYERVNGAFFIHHPITPRSRNFSYNCTASRTLPNQVLHASVSLDTNVIKLLNTNINCNQPNPPQDPDPPVDRRSILRLLKEKLPPWATQRLGATPSIDSLLQDIVTGKAILGSDGSYFPLTLKAGCSWCISSQDHSEFICGGGATPGDLYDHDSYRSEIAGLIGSSAALHVILPLLNANPTTFTIICDNEAALTNFLPSPRPLKIKWRHCDLVSLLRQIWNTSTCAPRPVHVYGHQEKRYGPPTLFEHINMHMDRRAKACALSFEPLNDHGPDWNRKGYGLVRYKGKIIGGAYKKNLYDGICHDKYVDYLSIKWNHDEETMKTQIAWPIFRKARKATPHYMRIFISKWLIGHLPTGSVMKQRRQRIHAKCPHCSCRSETLLHLVLCPSNTVQAFWATALRDLEQWLEEHHTEPHLATFLVLGLSSWLLDPYGDELTLENFPLRLHPTLTSHLELGWFALLSGFVHPDIVQSQQQHLSSLQYRTTGVTWASRLTQKLWQVLYDLWLLRNTTLHANTINENNGQTHLDFSISVEHHLGPFGLPSQFNPYFTTSLEALLAKPIESKIRWFRLIRRARELRELTIRDAFQSNATLRRWVHLPTTT